MAELKFIITNDHIKLERLSVAPVSDSINHLYASFDFDSAWDGCVKTAIFSGSGKVYHAILPDDNRCVIPWEVLTGARFAVSAFGTKDDFRITATELTIPLDKAGLKCAQTPSEPSDSAYTQLLQMLSWVITNKAALTKFAEGSTDVPNMINIRDGVTLAQELAAKANKTALEAKADKSYNSGFIGGSEARLNGVGGAAIGYKAQASLGGAAGNTSKADEGGAVGYGANTNHGGAVGKDAQSMHGGAVGRNAVTRLGAAIGDGAQTVDEDGNPITAIQLGGGTNTEPNTAKFFDYTVMNADGTIPAERIAAKSIAMDKLSDEVKTYIDESTGDLSDYYTKTETDTKIAEAKSIIPKRYIVSTLPTEDIDTNGTYLVPVEDPDTDNIYTEYAYIGGAWEIIGSPFEVDLSGYYTKDEIDEATTELSNGISEKIGKNDEVSVEISSGEIVDVTSTAWEALKSGLRADELVSSKADKSDVYTKTQIDTKLDDKADKPTITTPTGTSAELADNTEARFGEVTSLTLTLPSSTGDDYISAVIFTANSNTPLSYPDTIVMVGTDCIDGVFAPVSGKRYEVIVTNDGASYVGRVSGYEVTA